MTTNIADIPRDYLEWLIDTRKKDIATYQGELDRRDVLEAGSLSMVEKLVSAGYRALALKAHPDQGGTPAEFLELQGAKAQLDEVVKELKR